MLGLDEANQNINGLPGPLYLSSISGVIIQRQFSNIKNIKLLNIGEPTHVVYEDDDGNIYRITVTAVPAGHCPGSIMFLIQQNDLTILYTGDFR